ncbi:MAG: TIGR00341 family protein [Bacteroidales bacterium]|nr:TIGR00341 family protein [Bacteroidales bacterium]
MSINDREAHKLQTQINESEKGKASKGSENFISKIFDFLHDMFSISEGTDIGGTVQIIKRDIVFKGRSIWILIASIFIASIGLNQNSTAVVIGAMLISPLMGPILGVGLSVGTNDWNTLKRSLKFFLISMIVSVITSTVYFLITPLKEVNSELFARTQPTLLDVFIGIFGGMAGIIAGSSREKANVIPGVAIATALMPPLCTAGYGLATSQFSFFIGALYLFFINSVFISLSTFVAVKYLKFPMMNYVRPEREKKFKLYIFIFVLLIILPSAKIFWDVIQESRFNLRADNFIEENFKSYKSDIIFTDIDYSDTLSYIDIYLTDQIFSDAQIRDYKDKLPTYGLTKKCSGITVTDSTALNFHQEENNLDTLVSKIDNISEDIHNKLRVGVLEDIYHKQEDIIQSKNAKIEFLENQLIGITRDTLPLQSLKKELAVQYPRIEQFAFAKTIELNESNVYDTIPTLLVNWKKGTYNSHIFKKTKTLEEWLRIRLDLDTLRVVKY